MQLLVQSQAYNQEEGMLRMLEQFLKRWNMVQKSCIIERLRSIWRHDAFSKLSFNTMSADIIIWPTAISNNLSAT